MSLLSRLCFTVSRALLLALCGLCGAGLSPPVAAQGRTVRRSVRPARRAVAARPRAPRVPLDRLPPPGPPLLDFQVGQGAINVQIADITADTTIRLGLAPGGVTVVEFPADDFIFATYPGDENFVTLDPAMVQRQRPTDPLVFRPGAGFAVPAAGPNRTTPYGQITVQMVSGVVFTFHIYPVRELRHSTTRVSLTYQVADVVAARARAGLPVNLHLREMERTARVEPTPAPTPAATPEAGAVTLRLPAPAPPPVPPLTAEQEAQVLAATYLQQIASVLPRPPKGAVQRHGLALSAQPTRLLPDGNWQLDAVTVTNTLRQPLRLVNLPELYIETREGRHVLNRERCAVPGLASGLPADGLLQPGQSYTFTLVTRPPVLGARQFLAVAVAQTNAADEPAVLALLERAR